MMQNILMLLVSPSLILFQMQKGDVEGAIHSYWELHPKDQDLKLTQEIGLKILEQGLKTNDDTIQVAALFGAGVALHERLEGLIEGFLDSKNPICQLVALQQLSRLGNSKISQATRSDFLLVRLQALHLLAEKKDPKTVGQIETIFQKTPPQIWPPFVEVLAKCHDHQATSTLKRLMINEEKMVRLAALYGSGIWGRFDLLPQIRTLATHTDPIQKEAAIFALGALKDQLSIPLIEKGVESVDPNLRLTSLIALYKMGNVAVANQIEKEALQGNLFAITFLGEMEGKEDLLATICQRGIGAVRWNGAMALLKRKDSRALPILKEILLKNPKDNSLVPVTSPGKSLVCYRTIPSSRQQLQDNAPLLETSRQLKESLLIQAIELPQKEFLTLCREIFETETLDLVPTAIKLLENHKTQEAISFLKQEQQRLGSPLIRGWCTLCLFRMGEEGPYEDELKDWVRKNMGRPLFNFRPIISREMSDKSSSFEITPDEQAQLLVEAFQAFAATTQDKGIDLLLDAITHGNETNRYPLAGLLVRASQ
jgi:HEAT repeat protein